jgi:N-acetylglucosaminyldiphosphoundecaprenol N-acetyl-beta-D-mannosaminyltransferase
MEIRENVFDIFGLSVNEGELDTIVGRVLSHETSSSNVLVVTPNTDHFLRWKKSERFRELYNRANFRLVDGAPLFWIARLLGGKNVNRITGVDLTLKILDLLSAAGKPLAIIGGSPLAMERALLQISYRYPGVRVFFSSTPSIDELTSNVYLDEVAGVLNSEPEKVVLLCLGSPKQEEVFFELNNLSTSEGIYLCVGGTIDFLAGIKSRAPKYLQILGLEWFYRFIQEPKRLFRRYFLEDYKISGYLIRALLIKFSRILKSKFE